MDPKLFFLIAATILGTGALIPYFIDIFRGRTQPHAYTWLIWILTQGTAAAVAFEGGGGFGAYTLAIAAACNTIVFFLSLKFGTKNITKSDTAILIAALVAFIFWWQLDQPLIAGLMVTVIDFFGYIPTFRKSYQEPWSETTKSWFGFFLAMIFAILALEEYNWLTLPYIITIALSNLVIVAICLIRRSGIPRPV